MGEGYFYTLVAFAEAEFVMDLKFVQTHITLFTDISSLFILEKLKFGPISGGGTFKKKFWLGRVCLGKSCLNYNDMRYGHVRKYQTLFWTLTSIANI